LSWHPNCGHGATASAFSVWYFIVPPVVAVMSLILHLAESSNRRMWGTYLLFVTCSIEIANDRYRSMSTSQNQLATAALETLHGARGLPPAEATAKLRDFVDSIGTALTPTARLADASGALRTLVNQLQSQGAATDDTWEYAIETMLSYANESV
jgi:hypothetical protein